MKVMSVRTSWRTTTATIGPKTPPMPAREAHPSEDDGADADQRVGRLGTGVPMPVLAVSARPANAAMRPVIMYDKTFVRLTGTPLRNAASRLLPMA